MGVTTHGFLVTTIAISVISNVCIIGKRQFPVGTLLRKSIHGSTIHWTLQSPNHGKAIQHTTWLHNARKMGNKANDMQQQGNAWTHKIGKPTIHVGWNTVGERHTSQGANGRNRQPKDNMSFFGHQEITSVDWHCHCFCHCSLRFSGFCYCFLRLPPSLKQIT